MLGSGGLALETQAHGPFGGCGRRQLVVHWIYCSSALWLALREAVARFGAGPALGFPPRDARSLMQALGRT